MGRQIDANGERIHDICDDVDGDLEYITSAEDDEARKAAVMEFVRQKLNAALSVKAEGEDESPQKVIELGTVREFSDDELSMIMGRRRQGRSYPESAKDAKEFEFYELNGFVEAGDSRLLYKQVEE